MLGIPTRHYRIVVQSAIFALWIALIVATRHPMDSGIAKILPVSLLLRIDPLVLTVVSGGMRMGLTILLLGFVTLAVSLLMGRVFCGWVCPLGAIFDAWGYILKRLHVRIEGPSPWWFRFKFYLLAAILVFAILGGVSPLMGFDPIVLVTRVAATVLGPLARHSDGLALGAGAALGNHGALIDGATLLLFITIMAGTTRVSRIWCRTACPLGAYLAVLGRHSALRRETQGCVHCNICSRHCPTGAINFDNAEIYNESECIKCFACTQECPVDANRFVWKNPLPAVTQTHYPTQLDKRATLATVGGALVATPLLSLASGDTKASKTLIRPPMSREEHDFLSSCIRCAECMKACPSGILKPATLEHGVRALWSPVMVATEGACQTGCNACSTACPTDAITKYPVIEKYSYKAGTAVLNPSLCISYTENKYCSECVRACPTQAIEIKKGWEPEQSAAPVTLDVLGVTLAAAGADVPAPAGKSATRPVHVNFDRCVGCGACEYVCNQIVFGEPAMVTTSYGRALPTTVPESLKQRWTPS